MTTPRNDPAYRELARQIVDLRRRVDGFSRPQLGRSSLENTSINAYDQSGQIVSTYGRLPDGTYGAAVLSGPLPPTPTPPDVTVRRGIGLEVTWHGDYTVETANFPMAGGRLEVYVSDSAAITGASIPRTTIESPRGSTVTLSVSYDTPQYVAFALRSAAGRLSGISEVVGPYTVPRATAEDLDLNLEGIVGTQIFYGAEDPIVDANGGDLWYAETGVDGDGNALYESRRLVGGAWEPLADQGANAALVQAIGATTLSHEKAKWITSDTAPTPTSDDPHYSEHHTLWWIDSANGNRINAWHGDVDPPYWHEHKLGNGAIEPASLVASDVIATGTVSAALLEAVMVLATSVIAGDPTGDHARMSPDGFRVYKADTAGDGVPDEVVRMGTNTNDYFGIVDSAGNLVSSIDDTGRGSFSGLTVTGDPVFQGAPLSQILGNKANGLVGSWYGTIKGLEQAGANGIGSTEYGIAQVSFPVVAGRSYHIRWRMPFHYVSEAVGEVWQRLIYKIGGAPTPADYRECGIRLFSGYAAASWMLEVLDGYFEADATGTCTVMLAMRHEWGTATSRLKIVENAHTEVQVNDTGLRKAVAGGQSSSFGSLAGTPPPPPPPPTQGYYVDLGSAGRMSHKGDGGHMNWVGSEMYQGWESTNGDTRSQAWFDLPNITGTVDRVDVYLYFRHWWFNSGGTVIMNISDQRGLGPNPHKFKGDWHTGGWPKPGGRTVTLPSDWFPLFRGTNNDNYNGRATVVTLGPGGGTNQIHYGVATDIRLRIWYTQ